MTAVSPIVTYFDTTGDRKLTPVDFTRDVALKFAAETPARQKELLAHLFPKLRKALLEALYIIRTDTRVTEPQCATGNCFEFDMKSPIDQARMKASNDARVADSAIRTISGAYAAEGVSTLLQKFRTAPNIPSRAIAFGYLREIGDQKPGLRSQMIPAFRAYYDTPEIRETEYHSGTFIHLWSDIEITLRNWGNLKKSGN